MRIGMWIMAQECHNGFPGKERLTMSDCITMKEYIDQAEKDLLHTYNRFQIVLDKGVGVHLYDLDGKKYLDFCAGIAVFALGYGNETYNNALKEQIDKFIADVTELTCGRAIIKKEENFI